MLRNCCVYIFFYVLSFVFLHVSVCVHLSVSCTILYPTCIFLIFSSSLPAGSKAENVESESTENAKDSLTKNSSSAVVENVSNSGVSETTIAESSDRTVLGNGPDKSLKDATNKTQNNDIAEEQMAEDKNGSREAECDKELLESEKLSQLQISEIAGDASFEDDQFGEFNIITRMRVISRHHIYPFNIQGFCQISNFSENQICS